VVEEREVEVAGPVVEADGDDRHPAVLLALTLVDLLHLRDDGRVLVHLQVRMRHDLGPVDVRAW